MRGSRDLIMIKKLRQYLTDGLNVRIIIPGRGVDGMKKQILQASDQNLIRSAVVYGGIQMKEKTGYAGGGTKGIIINGKTAQDRAGWYHNARRFDMVYQKDSGLRSVDHCRIAGPAIAAAALYDIKEMQIRSARCDIPCREKRNLVAGKLFLHTVCLPFFICKKCAFERNAQRNL